MRQNDIDIFRKCKRKIQAEYINQKRNRKYLLQTEEQYKNIKKLLKNTSCLFITHDNGGGTRMFENSNKYKYTSVVILRRLKHAFMEDMFFSIEIIDNNKEVQYLIKIDDLNIIFENEYDIIIVNSLVTYQCYDMLLGMLIKYKKMNTACLVKYFVHDYHAVCPNLNLHINECYCYMECSRNNCELYNGNFPVSIQKWRDEWKAFFEVVDEIHCFSESSKKIIERAYPLVNKSKIIVKPHDTTYCVNEPISGIDELPLCIGFVGTIHTVEKGKAIVGNVIKRYGSHIPIRIIGTRAWRYGIFRRKVKYIGPYKRDELRKILMEQKVSLIIFPSVCPETFSYLISELMPMNIPIICLNYGAQAEKIKRYPKGIVCANLEEIYQQIDKMYEKNKLQNGAKGI